MRIWVSLLACASAMVLALLVSWPSVSLQTFPVPGYRNAVAGSALNLLAAAAVGFAVWVAAFWEHARRHQWLFVPAAMACFLFAAIFVSVAVGMGFAVLSILVRSK